MVTVVPLFHFILYSNILFKIIDSQQEGELKLLSNNKTNYDIQGFDTEYKWLNRSDNKYAIDGDKIQNVTAGALCAFQKFNAKKNMWAVDLEKDYIIKKVVIYGRTDCCKDEIIGTKILILPAGNSDSLESFQGFDCGESIGVVRDYAIYTVNCDTGGRFVKIVKEEIDFPALCEVEVWGEQIG